MRSRLATEATEFLTLLAIIIGATLVILIAIPLSIVSLSTTLFSSFKKATRKPTHKPY